MPIDLVVPGAGLPPQDAQGGNSALAQALLGKQADLDFRLVQPTPMLGRVMDREAVPDRAAPFLSEIVGEGLPAMDIQVIHHQVDLSRTGIAAHDRLQRLGKFWRRAVGGGQGEMPTGFRLHGAEDIGGAASFVLVVPFRRPTGGSGNRRPDVGVQRDWLLVQADDWFSRSVRFFIGRQNVFHLLDVLLIQFRHAPHFFPATALGHG